MALNLKSIKMILYPHYPHPPYKIFLQVGEAVSKHIENIFPILCRGCVAQCFKLFDNEQTQLL